MTLKKNFDRDPSERPKDLSRNPKSDRRIKLALRHGQFDALYDDEFDAMGGDLEDDDE